MRDNPRTTVVSAVLGVVLLGGLFVFTVVVPELTEDAESSESGSSENAGTTDGSAIELPDRLSGGFVAADLGTLPPDLAEQLGDIEALIDQEDSIAEGLGDVFGAPGDFRVYAVEDGSALAQVTVLDRAPGLFTPDALPIDPAVLGVARPASELVEVDGAVCAITWGQEVPEGQPVDETQPPQAVRCQLGDEDRTYELTSQGLLVDEAVAVLRDLAEA